MKTLGLTMKYNYDGCSPTIHPNAFVCDEATIIGDVVVKEKAGVWPGSVLRGDMEQVVLGRYTHIEDGSIVHMSDIGEDVLVGHGAVVDGAKVGDNCLLSNNSVINYHAEIGDNCIVAAGAVIPEGEHVPDGSFVYGIPADYVPHEESSVNFKEIRDIYSGRFYAELAEKHIDLFNR